jgi:hypothetical protein
LLFDRELDAAFRARGTLEAVDGNAAADCKLRFTSPFAGPMRAQFDWKIPKGWSVSGTTGLVELAAAEQIALDISATTVWPHCYPTPKLTVTLTGPDASNVCRNAVHSYVPFRVWPKRVLQPNLRSKPIKIDAEPEDWEGCPEVSQFVTLKGDALAKQQTRVRVLHDATHLYVFAYVDMSDPERFGKGRDKRDAVAIYRDDESFSVHVGTDKGVYTFSVNTKNTQYDAKRANARYNAKYESAVAKAATTWYCEMRIPRSAWQGQAKRINFTHTDGRNRAKSQWVPTFGQYLDKARYGYVKGL